MGAPPSAIRNLAVDSPLVQNAGYRFDAQDRAYIDDQIRGCQSLLVQCLATGTVMTWVRVDTASAALAVGNAVVLSGTSGGVPTIKLALAAAVLNSPCVFGVVVVVGAPGGLALIAGEGVVPQSITGIPLGGPGVAILNTSTAGYTVIDTPHTAAVPAGSYVVGAVDGGGNLTLARATVSQASGGAGTVPTGTGWYHVTGSAADAASITAGDSAIVGGAFTIASLSSASAIPLTARLSSVTNPATIGMLGAANNITIIGARNSGNSGNIPLLGSDASNNLILGDGSTVSSAIILAAAAVVQKIGAVAVASLGIAAGDFIRLGAANFPATGGVRLGNNILIQTANTIGTQCNLIGLDNTNAINIGDATVAASLRVDSNGSVAINSQAGLVAFQTAGVSRAFVEAGGMSVNGAGSYGGGVGVMCLINATTAPSTNPTGGGVFYAATGASRWRGSGGAITQTAPAGVGTKGAQLALADCTMAFLTTTNNTLTTAVTYAMTAASTGHFRLRWSARKTAGAVTVGDSAGGTIECLVRQVGGVATRIGAPATLSTWTDTSMNTLAPTLNASGANMIVQATGTTGDTIEWEFYLEELNN